MEDILALTATDLVRLYRTRALSPVDVVRACLDRIWMRDPDVRAWAHVDGDIALAAARALPAEPMGVLHGVPVGFKDIVDTAALPTEYGSPIYIGNRPARDAACVTAARRAGGILLGKTATTEFAGRHPTKTANPLDPRRTPGGSSSGSAAAVGDRQVYLSIGSQTAGSTIRPAAYCGAYALKPTFGTIPFDGMKQLSERLDTIGLMARSVDDLVLFRSALLGVPVPAPAPLPQPLRIGLCRTPYWMRASAEVRAAVEAAAQALAGPDTHVREVDYPDGFGDAEELCWQTINFEMARHLAWELETHPNGLSPWLRIGVEKGLAQGIAAHEANLRRLDVAERRFTELFETVDVLLTPAAGEEAPMGLSDTGSPIFNLPFQIAGLPAVTVPLGTGPAGLPLGLQLVGPRYGDGRLLDIARAIEPRLPAGS